MEKAQFLEIIDEYVVDIGCNNNKSLQSVFVLAKLSRSLVVTSSDLENYDFGIPFKLGWLIAESKETEYKLIARGWVDRNKCV